MTDFESQSLTRTLNELLILRSIRDEPMHGYQIALDIEERSAGYFSFKHGTLYPILHRLEKEGYIDGTWGSGRGPRRRKEYRISAGGIGHLQELAGYWQGLGDRLSDFLGGEGTIRGRAASGER